MEYLPLANRAVAAAEGAGGGRAGRSGRAGCTPRRRSGGSWPGAAERQGPAGGRNGCGQRPGRSAETAISAKGRHVVIIGGGDTGADCLGTALRQGAASVTQLEILPRPPDDRPAGQPWPVHPAIFRVSSAHEEGGERVYAVSTQRFLARLGTAGCAALVLVEVEPAGGRIPAGARYRARAALRPGAAGDGVHRRRGRAAGGRAGRGIRQRGNMARDGKFATSVPGVFVAGDMGRGQSLIVWAIAEGRSAAAAVDAYLCGRPRFRLPSAGGRAAAVRTSCDAAAKLRGLRSPAALAGNVQACRWLTCRARPALSGIWALCRFAPTRCAWSLAWPSRLWLTDRRYRKAGGQPGIDPGPGHYRGARSAWSARASTACSLISTGTSVPAVTGRTRCASGKAAWAWPARSLRARSRPGLYCRWTGIDIRPVALAAAPALAVGAGDLGLGQLVQPDVVRAAVRASLGGGDSARSTGWPATRPRPPSSRCSSTSRRLTC